MDDRIKKNRIFLLRPKAAIIERSAQPRAIRPSYILKYAEALLKQSEGFDVKFIDCFIHHLELKTLINMVLDFKPHIICICQMSFDKDFTERFIVKISKNLSPL